MLRPARTMEPERDCIRLRSVGYQQDKWRSLSVQEATRSAVNITLSLERFDDRQDDDGDHQHGRYLIDNTIEFVAARIAVEGEVPGPAAKQAV